MEIAEMRLEPAMLVRQQVSRRGLNDALSIIGSTEPGQPQCDFLAFRKCAEVTK